MKIQRMTVIDPTADCPTVEMTLADHENVDEASVVIVASVEVSRQEVSFSDLQLRALTEAIEGMEDVRNQLRQQSKPSLHSVEGLRKD